MRLRSGLLILLMMFGVPMMSTSCSTSGQEESQEEFGDQEDGQEENFADEEQLQNQEGEDNLNNLNNFNNMNENLESAGFNNAAGGNNQFLNNEGNQFANNNFQSDLGNEELQNEGELQQIIEDMNASNGDQFAQQDAALNNPMMQNNGMLMNDQGMGNQMMENINQGMDQGMMMNQGMNQAMDQGMMNQGMENMAQAPMEQQSMATAGSPMAPGLPELGSKMSYIVQKGDTLAKIATRVYGDPQKWAEIADFTGIANPKLIYPGDVVYYQLTEQTMAFASSYESVTRSEVRVMEGDTLSTIASRVLGNAANWKMIWRQNDNIANPDRLEVGSTLYYIEPGMLSATLETARDFFVQASDTMVDLAEATQSQVDQGDKLEDKPETINSVTAELDDEFAMMNTSDFERVI
ncbi:LysM peptidoglycan-binding domain-containing protein [Pseudobacteriovorax antillogorgiicola]|nr:LysM domain-containing protein [Pseudobacteriovorax antillogorgiicola]